MILLIITYIAGVLTILSPCILPVLPFVFAKAQGSFLKNGLPLLLGMAITFSLLSGLAIVGGAWIAQANEVGRILAMILMTVFGLALIFPKVSDSVFAPLSRFGARMSEKTGKSNKTGNSVLIGVSTGLLWAPCAGPILGLVLTGAASQGNNISYSILLLLFYSLGACTSLALALVAGNKFFSSLKKFLGFDQVVKKVLGVAVLVGVAAIAFNLDRTVLTRISKFGTESIEHKLLSLGGLDQGLGKSSLHNEDLNNLPVEGLMPELDGAVSWLNSKPLSKESLKGKVILIDFWTYSCINCLRTLPYVRKWNEKYKNKGLVIIGVHTPEFAFEKSVKNVKKAIKDLGITYPVALDNNYKIWRAFDNRYWPAHYFVDRSGQIRYHHFGEGAYEHSEKVLRKLLSENGEELEDDDFATETSGVEVQKSKNVKSPETYVGFGRAKNFVAKQSMQKNKEVEYEAARTLSLNQWSLNGRWQLQKQRAVLKQSGGKVYFRFKARDLHLVLGGNKIAFQVKIDGHRPGADHGVDTNEMGQGLINGHRLYQLIRQSGKSDKEEHLFEIEFQSPGAEVYAFTFG